MGSEQWNIEEEKILAVLKALIIQWKIEIENIDADMVCFLPFDFSDEYIGCFRFEKVENRIHGSYGSTQKITGWMISPSKLDQFQIEESDYRITSKIFEVEEGELLASLDSCLTKFRSG